MINMTLKKKLRQSARHAYLSFVGLFSSPSSYVHILNGHMIARHQGTKEDMLRYERLLEKLHKDCEFVNFQDAVQMIVNKVPVTKPTIAFTFDDGFDDCYNFIAPVLEKYGINAMFFINPNFADAADNDDEDYISNFTNNTTLSPGKRPMTWAQIKDLQKRGFLFGAHTMDHYMVNHGSKEDLEYQIVECKEVLEAKLNTPCDYFAWPYGQFKHTNKDAVNLACKTYKYVFSQSDHKHYFSFNGMVINRRHAEAWWPISHIRYFISCKRT